MAIDDPVEAIQKQYKDEANPIIKKLLELAGKLHPAIGIVNVVRTWFSEDMATAKINALLDQLIGDVKRCEESLGKPIDASKLFETPAFAEAVLAAMNESVRTADINKIKRYAAVLGSGISGTLTPWDEIAAYIRDLSQLTELDITVLRILYDTQRRVFQEPSQVTNPNNFTDKMPELLKKVDMAKISHDDFYARCARLSGFGLALEVQRNDARYAPSEHCFRLTGRGYDLTTMLRHLD